MLGNQKKILGIPVVTKYTYLGVVLDQCQRYDLELERKKLKEVSLQKATFILRSKNLNSLTHYHVWQMLFRSRVWYQLALTASVSDSMKQW